MTETNRTVDLRSDTVTKPSAEMRAAMAEAVVGDDVLGDDPTVIALEQKVASILGKEAALYCPSGTMVNQISIKVQTQPGDEIICEEYAHLYFYESGAPFFISNVSVTLLKGHNGMITAEQVRGKLKQNNIHQPETRLVCIENTHNRHGGRIMPLESIALMRELCNEKGLRMHLDGARLWNASVASGIPLKEYAKFADTVNVCLSKGMGAPVGSCLVSDRATIEKARKYRKMLGGGMRQSGILAAAGLYAIENNLARLAEDHANAALLARGLSEIPAIRLNPADVETNIVIFQLEESAAMSAPELCEVLKTYGVLMLPVSERGIRAVTHLDVDAAGCSRAVEVIGDLLRN